MSSACQFRLGLNVLKLGSHTPGKTVYILKRAPASSCSSAAVDDPGQFDVILAEAGALANTALPIRVLGGDGGTTVCAERL